MRNNLKKYEENIRPTDQAESLREMMKQRGKNTPLNEQKDTPNDPLEFKNDQADTLREIMKGKNQQTPSSEQRGMYDDPLEYKNDQADELRRKMREIKEQTPSIDQKREVVLGSKDQAAVQLKQILDEMYQEAELEALVSERKTTYVAGLFEATDGEVFLVLSGPGLYRAIANPLKSTLKPLFGNESKISTEIKIDHEKTVINKTDISW